MENFDGYCVFYIDTLSEELKEVIRKNLSAICNGIADAASGRKMFSYNATLKEFVKRYAEKSEDQKKGLIGELILHILLLEFMLDFNVCSPFFNMEERSVKKGFDVVLIHSKDQDMWIAESKSGNIHRGKTSNQTIAELINTAKNDLKTRLNGESNSLWTNAITGAKKVFEENNDKKKAIIDILQECGDAAYNSKLKSSDINVMLVGTLFHDINEKFTQEHIKDKKERIDKENLFKKVYVVGIQKETYQNVYNFLNEESQL